VLQPLHLGPVAIDRSRYLPPTLLPLVEATRRGDDVVPALQTATGGADKNRYQAARRIRFGSGVFERPLSHSKSKIQKAPSCIRDGDMLSSMTHVIAKTTRIAPLRAARWCMRRSSWDYGMRRSH